MAMRSLSSVTMRRNKRSVQRMLRLAEYAKRPEWLRNACDLISQARHPDSEGTAMRPYFVKPGISVVNLNTAETSFPIEAAACGKE